MAKSAGDDPADRFVIDRDCRRIGGRGLSWLLGTRPAEEDHNNGGNRQGCFTIGHVSPLVVLRDLFAEISPDIPQMRFKLAVKVCAFSVFPQGRELFDAIDHVTSTLTA